MTVPLKQLRVKSDPFRHIVAWFDDRRLLEDVLKEFPNEHWKEWYRHGGANSAGKRASRGALPGPATESLVAQLSEESFLKQLAEWLNIERPLLVDPTREGGGLHCVEPGGYLGMHVDFNVHPQFKWDRRVNLLLYLNRGWVPGHGGYLELGDYREVKYPPEIGLLVAFPTRDDTLHGHPTPVTRHRRSIALYYYSEGRPDHEKSDEHVILYKTGKM